MGTDGTAKTSREVHDDGTQLELAARLAALEALLRDRASRAGLRPRVAQRPARARC